MTASSHDYLSTACLHEACGSCRQTCKYCDSSCQHSCHPQYAATDGRPQTWVEQARDVSREMLHLLRQVHWLPDDLRERIETDPSLFWLRGEVHPPGTWQRPKSSSGDT